MEVITFWVTTCAVIAAAVSDVRTRRVPNWLVAPYFLAGIAAHAIYGGVQGVVQSLAGIGLAIAVTGVLYYLRSLGMGDLKLCAAVGAWVGPNQMVFALWGTALAGGVLAVMYAMRHGTLDRTLAGAGSIMHHLVRKGLRPHPTLNLDNPTALKVPYAVAIAVGTVFSFYTQ